MQNPRADLGHRADIDGLRALAITSVVAYHCGLPWVGGGYAGVDIFFVISGYLIGYLVYREIRENSFSIRQFYSRRAKRILPALFTVLLFSYFAAELLLSPLEMKRFAESALAAIASSSNIFFLKTSGYFAPRAELNPLLMTWSLAVEEQFYVLFPLLMILLRKTSRRRLIGVLAAAEVLSLAASIVVTMRHPASAFFLLPSRAWEIGAGVLLAVWESGRSDGPPRLRPLAANALSLAGISSMIAAITLFTARTPFPGYEAALPVAGAVMFLAARGGYANRALSLRPIAFIGLVSYSWYLWHWPLLSFARICSVTEISSHTLAIIGALAFGISVICWRFIEQPFRQSRTAPSRLLVRYAGSALAIALPAVLVAMVPVAGGSREVLNSLDRVGDSLRGDLCVANYGSTAPDLSARCVPQGAGQAVALIGDSHAAALATAVRNLAQQSGYRLIELTKSSCPALDGVTRNVAGHPLHEAECTDFNHEVLSYITRNPAIHIVIISAFWSAPFRDEMMGERYVLDGADARNVSRTRSQELLQIGLKREIWALECAGKEVFLVQDSPSFNFDPVDELQTRLIRPRRLVSKLLSQEGQIDPSGVAVPRADRATREASEAIAAVANADPRVHLTDVWGKLCSADGCRFALGDRSLYIDDQHLSPLGARVALSDLKLPVRPNASSPCLDGGSF